MKKLIKTLSFMLLLFVGILILNSNQVQAATKTNGIVCPSLDNSAKAERQDEGNITRYFLKEGRDMQNASELSKELQTALNYSNGKIGITKFYIPLPEDFATKYSEVKTFNILTSTGERSYESDVTLVDEKFEVTTDITKAKYLERKENLIRPYANENNIHKLFLSSRTVNMALIDKAGKEVGTKQYSYYVIPAPSANQITIIAKYDSDKNDASLYRGNYDYKKDTTNPLLLSRENEETVKLDISNMYSKLSLNAKTTYKSENEKIATVSKDGTIIVKAAGQTTITANIDGITLKIPVTVYPKRYFSEKEVITDEQINDLIAYAKMSNYDIWYNTSAKTNPVVPAKLFKAAKEIGTGLSVGFEAGDLIYSWYFDAKDIKDTSKDVNLTIAKIDGFDEKIKNIEDAVCIEFKHNGNLPGKAYVGIEGLYGKDFNDEDMVSEYKEISLYYFNEEKNKLEYSTKANRSYDGYIWFEIDHCSKYLATEEDDLNGYVVGGDNSQTPNKENKGNTNNKNNKQLDPNQPKMGDTQVSMLGICSSVLVFATLGAIYIIKK